MKKTGEFLIVLILIVKTLNSSPKYSLQSYFCFNTFYFSNIQNTTTIPSYKIGFQRFSSQASIEHKLSIHRHLTFSLQYSLAFFNLLQQKLQQFVYETKNNQPLSISNFVQTNVEYKLKNRVSLISGLGLISNQPIPKFNFTNEQPSFSKSPPEHQNFKTGFYPYFMIGIEKNCSLFKKEMTYSFQYHIGFLPFNHIQNEYPSHAEKDYFQGISIGIKYKY